MNWKSVFAACVVGCQLHVDGAQIFLASDGAGVVEQFDSGTHSGTTFASGFASPIGLAFDGTGNLYVGDYAASTIYRFSPNGVRTTFATTGLGNPMGLAVDGAGNVYAANLGGNDITKYAPNGSESVFANVAQPKGLAFDGAGNLYVSTGNNTILRYDSLGHSEVFATASMGLNAPLAMQFDAAGDLFVANYSGSDILKRDTAGNWSVFAATPPGYSNPVGLAIDVDGSIYVSCAGNFIEKYDAQGNGTFFASTVNGPWMLAIEPVPEPSSIVLLLAAAATICLHSRMKRRAGSRPIVRGQSVRGTGVLYERLFLSGDCRYTGSSPRHRSLAHFARHRPAQTIHPCRHLSRNCRIRLSSRSENHSRLCGGEFCGRTGIGGGVLRLACDCITGGRPCSLGTRCEPTGFERPLSINSRIPTARIPMTAPAIDQMARFDLPGDAFDAAPARNRAPIIAAAMNRPSLDSLRASKNFQLFCDSFQYDGHLQDL